MNDQYVEVDLTSEEKKLIMKLASFFVTDEITQADLTNSRRKWVRFKTHAISEVVGELSYHFNRCNNSYMSELLDALICHLESHEKNWRSLG